MTGKQTLGVVAAILVATAVLPPATAFAVNQRRISRAAEDARSIAERLGAQLRPGAAESPDVFDGPGHLPTAGSPDALAWLSRTHGSLTERLGGAAVPADPWGNCYVASAAWVVSAGPNGIIETPFRATAPAGDDVAARVR